MNTIRLKTLDILKLIFISGIIIYVLFPIINVFTSSLILKTDKSISAIWYTKALENKDFLEGILNSSILGIISSLISLILSAYLCFNWGIKSYRKLILFIIIATATLPADIQSIGVQIISKYIFGFSKSNLISIVFAEVLYIFPFLSIIIILSISQINHEFIDIANDLGADNYFFYRKVLFPIIWPSMLSALLMGFLLVFNEYSRIFYLSGPKKYLTEVIYGKMSSGSDQSVYAIGVINVFIAIIIIIITSISIVYIRKRTIV